MAKSNNYIDGKILKEELHLFAHSHKVEAKEIYLEQIAPELTDDMLDDYAEDKIEELKENILDFSNGDMKEKKKEEFFGYITKYSKRKTNVEKLEDMEYDKIVKGINWDKFKTIEIKELKKKLWWVIKIY